MAALNPANAVEVGFAAQWVAASAHARECLRRANHPDTDIATSRKYTTQSVSMTRQSQGTLRTLHALRADREKRAATARAKYETASSRTNILAFPKHNRASRPPES